MAIPSLVPLGGLGIRFDLIDILLYEIIIPLRILSREASVASAVGAWALRPKPRLATPHRASSHQLPGGFPTVGSQNGTWLGHP